MVFDQYGSGGGSGWPMAELYSRRKARVIGFIQEEDIS